MSTSSGSYLNITRGDNSIIENSEAEELLRNNLEKIKTYAKISLGRVIKNSAALYLNSTFGIIPGQSISGSGIPEDSYVIDVDDSKNMVIMNNCAENSSTHVIITVNSNDYAYENEEDEYYSNGYYSEAYYVDEESIQNY
jgi:hypothetical protein